MRLSDFVVVAPGARTVAARVLENNCVWGL